MNDITTFKTLMHDFKQGLFGIHTQTMEEAKQVFDILYDNNITEWQSEERLKYMGVNTLEYRLKYGNNRDATVYAFSEESGRLYYGAREGFEQRNGTKVIKAKDFLYQFNHDNIY